MSDNTMLADSLKDKDSLPLKSNESLSPPIMSVVQMQPNIPPPSSSIVAAAAAAATGPGGSPTSTVGSLIAPSPPGMNSQMGIMSSANGISSPSNPAGLPPGASILPMGHFAGQPPMSVSFLINQHAGQKRKRGEAGLDVDAAKMQAANAALAAGGKVFHNMTTTDIKRRMDMTEDERAKKRQRRLLQNRQSAALSRQRKKEYIVSIDKKNAEIERALEKANQRIVELECLIAPEVLATLPVYKPEEKSSDDLRHHKDDDDDDDDDDDIDDDEDDSHEEGEGLNSDDNNISIDATGDEEMKDLADHSNGEEMKKD